MSNIRHLFLAFYVILLLPLLCSATIANCANTTNSGTVCLTCDPGYQLTNSGASCTQYDCSGMTNCTLCESTTLCLRCGYGYSLNSGRTACPKTVCVDSQCNFCASTSAQTCFQCSTGYYLNSTNLCTSCSSITNCSICSMISSTLTCQSCISGYYTSTANQCSTCASGQSNCLNCDSVGAGSLLCYDCIDTHYISNYVSGTCSLCNSGITSCVTCA
jgi:hypothetical protein